MAQQHKILGQLNPAATGYATLYTVPAATQAICSTLSICNTGVSTTYRVAVKPPTDVSLSGRHFIVYDAAINQYDSAFLTLGLSLQSGSSVSIYGGTSTLAFSLFGVEIS